MDNYISDMPLWKSYVWHHGRCFFVSTIERSYDIAYAGGCVRGAETLAWNYDYDKKERGEMIYHGGGFSDHQAACRCLIATGNPPDENSPEHERFFK